MFLFETFPGLILRIQITLINIAIRSGTQTDLNASQCNNLQHLVLEFVAAWLLKLCFALSYLEIG